MKTFKKFLDCFSAKREIKVSKVFYPGKIKLTGYSFSNLVVVLFLFALLFISGCGGPEAPPVKVTEPTAEKEPDKISIYEEYSPQKIDILPLTEFNINKNTQEDEIHLFVSLLDSFGSKIKSPCTIRAELYVRVQRSSDPKGDRVMIWPDVDLNSHVHNNEYWRDFLRAYEFELPFEPQVNQTYILEVTCLVPSNKRITAEFILKPQSEF